jgi:hypothetical protein
MLLIFFILWAVANLALIVFCWGFGYYNSDTVYYSRCLNLGMIAVLIIGTTAIYLEKLI